MCRALQIQCLYRTIDIQAVLVSNDWSVPKPKSIDIAQNYDLEPEVGTLISTQTAIELSRRRRLHKRLQHPRCWLRFRTPLWLIRRAIEVQAHYCSSPWEYTFRIYHIVPACSPVFEHVENGDIESLKVLVREDPSCLTFRITAEGATPLHMAVESGQVEMARFLISQGADPHEQTLRRLRTPNQAYSCLDLLTHTLIFKTHPPETTVDLLHLLVEENECDDLMGNASILYLRNWLNNSAHLTETESSSCFQLIQRNIWPPYQSARLGDRLRTAVATIKRHPQHFWAALGQSDFDEECVALARSQTLDPHPLQKKNPLPDLLSSIARLLVAHDCHSNDQGCIDPSLVLAICRHIFSRYITAGGTEVLIMTAACCLTSFIKVFLNALVTFDNIGMIWDYGIKTFAQELILAGVSRSELSAIGSKARQLLRGEVIEQGVYKAGFWCTHQNLVVRLIEIKYGPRSLDWSIWISHNKDEHVGEFWEAIERDRPAESAEVVEENEERLHSIPGSWIDENDHPKQRLVSIPPGSRVDKSEQAVLIFNAAGVREWGENTLKHCAELHCIAQVLSLSRRKRRRVVRYVGSDTEDGDSKYYHQTSLKEILLFGRERERTRRVDYAVEKRKMIGLSDSERFLSCRNMFQYTHRHFDGQYNNTGNIPTRW